MESKLSVALDAILSAALDAIVAEFKADSGTFHLLEADGILHLKAATASIPEFVLERVRLVPVGKGMAGLAAERKEPITVSNLQTNTSGDVRPGARATGMEGALVVPIFLGDDVAGTVGIANREPRMFTSEETWRLIELGRGLVAK